MGHKLICLVGMAGAGKSEVAGYFVKKGYQYIRFGQLTLDEVKKRGWPVNEKNERLIREGFRKKFGMAAFAILNMSKFNKALKKGNVLGDGLYSWAEYKVLKEKYGKNMLVVAVCASPRIRYSRLSDRASRYGDDPKMKYRSFSPEDAQSRDYAEIENIDKGGPIVMADYTIINEGSLKELKRQFDKIIKKIA